MVLTAFVETVLNLAYPGARAEKPEFNIALEKHLDPAIGRAELYPRKLTRALLSLLGNGLHAAHAKRTRDASAGFQPTASVRTRRLPSHVEIRVRDNGAGIPDAVKGQIFEPFLTTKPTEEGTGLGLSLSHNIVAKQHCRTFGVVTEPGSFAEFVVTLPCTGTPRDARAP